MSVRLNKALRELNIGLQTAVDFLKKKNLGEVEANPNVKISDEQYDALIKAFSDDKDLKSKANKILDKKKEEKEEREELKRESKAEVISAQAQAAPSASDPVKLKEVGKIDLAQFEKKPKKAQKKEVKESAPQQKSPKEEKADTIAKPLQSAVAESVEVQDKHHLQSVKAEEKTAAEPDRAEVKPVVTPPVSKVETKLPPAPSVNVVGKIDLENMNQSTRPKKKSKEEKRKEREEKNQQAQAANTEKKKRNRIVKGRVDIDEAIKKSNVDKKHDGINGKKKKKKQLKPLEVNEEDVARQVKETLARLTSKGQNKKGAKYRREKRDAVYERLQEELAEERAESSVLKLTEFVTANELANMMNVPVTKVIATCMNIGIMVSINQRLDAETINIVADEFGFKTEYVSAEVSQAITEEEDDENDLVTRAPIVTVMGHVDHGKTSLLDYIRKTHVIAGEAGGITQHIGAYNVKLENGEHITFLDTPGHEAFTAMRARGAQVTDIAIIIIAADDSVMPTTREAIAHAQAANVPMVFAINKIDKPGANPDKIREDLSQMNLLVEEWGGKYQCQEISAKQGIGVNELLEKVLLEAEMLELKANPNRKATGSVIESSLEKGRGNVCTVLVSNGTLHQGDIVLAGTYWGRVRAMFNERNQRVDEAKPAQAVTIIGLNGAPTAGDSFHIMDTEQEAKEITNKRNQLQREQGLRTHTGLTLEEIGHRIALGEFHELNLIVKGDTDGAVEALA
ncbi:MAG: translation initiation factor IF-2, partial [Prevotellaceae bacterium]|nr:translation initiation factor IF-2 [Prevotellaceae bacterium]